MNILFTCVGRRKYLVDYFKAEKDFVTNLVGADMSKTAPALAACDSWYTVPSIYDKGYINSLLDICKKQKINALISLNDMELPILAKDRERFSELGVALILADDNAIDICSDKYKTYLFCKGNDIPVPEAFLSVMDAVDSILMKKVNYPLIVKPRWGSASFGLYVVENETELRDAFDMCKKSLSDSYLSQFKKSSDDVLIQEYINGKEYGVDIFNDLTGKFRAVVCKEKLSMRAGETDKAVTVSSERFYNFCRTIGDTLKHVGNMDCDFLEKDGQLYLLELNPRFGGGYPFSHEAGANLVKALLLSICDRNDEITIDYSLGLTFAKCDVLIPAR